MKANAWRKFLEEQRDRHGKVLFTVTELANVAGTSRAALNVELTRLRNQEIIAKYAHGLYGLPGAVSPQVLVPAIDSHAYITGHYALYGHHSGDPGARRHYLLHGPAESPVAGAGHAGRALGLCMRAERSVLSRVRRGDCSSGAGALRLCLSFPAAGDRAGGPGHFPESRPTARCRFSSHSRAIPNQRAGARRATSSRAIRLRLQTGQRGLSPVECLFVAEHDECFEPLASPANPHYIRIRCPDTE